MAEVDLTFVDEVVSKVGTSADRVLELLQAVQAHYGYLPAEALERICELTEITPAGITGISTFYDQFRHSPCGEHIVRVCVGTACHVKGASLVYDAFMRHLEINDGGDTDADGLFTIEKVACLGCCTLAPAVQIGEITYGHVKCNGVGSVLEDYLRRDSVKKKNKKKGKVERVHSEGEIRIGLGSCCVARGSGKLLDVIEGVLAETSINAKVKHVGCVGMCYQTPLLEIVLPDGKTFLYTTVDPEEAKSIILNHFKVGGFVKKLKNSVSGLLDRAVSDNIGVELCCRQADVRDGHIADFLGKQEHICTEHCGVISPADLDEYFSKGGFEAFKRCLGEMDNDQVIGEIEKSGIRGRGGAGFPTHLKWKAVKSQDCGDKYIICNGDEGDPGAFMDRMLMESYPLRVIEGIAIAARAVGASKGFLYIRAEYPLAVKRVQEAIDKCVDAGLLGDDILGSGYSLSLKIVQGAGAFVCGEESALIASIEGKRGMPRLRPPFPAESGLWGKSTLINNVETYSAVPWIMNNGGDEFAKHGTETSTGTKVFALAGKVANGGLIEVPMGISLREIVEGIGGGVAEGRTFKAVQIGGPSGGCIPAVNADISVDYESLTSVGAIMGSGGLVVLDDTDCMVDIARYFLEFTQDQSCGKCTFCRVGTRRMLDILERLCEGKGQTGDIEKLHELSLMVKKGSLCGLGKTAPNPVLSTIEYFRDEYEAHLEGRCPAGKCKGLITYKITDDCIGCTICAQRCPADAIEFTPYVKHEIDTEKCFCCDTCRNVCPAEAVKVE